MPRLSRLVASFSAVSQEHLQMRDQRPVFIDALRLVPASRIPPGENLPYLVVVMLVPQSYDIFPRMSASEDIICKSMPDYPSISAAR